MRETGPWSHRVGVPRVCVLGIVAILTVVALLLAGTPGEPAADPASPIRMCAEWEPAFGTLIRWPLGIPSSLVVELAADDSLYVLVESSGQENQASSTFQAWGVNLDHVRFIRANTYSHWTRDWGPHSVFDGDGLYGITDPEFDGYPWVAGCFMESGPGRCDKPAGFASLTTITAPAATTVPAAIPTPAATTVPAAVTAQAAVNASGTHPAEGDRFGRGYEEDDAVNAVLADEFACPLHEMPAFCTGGNIMTDGHGIAFSTRRMVNENAYQWTESEFRALSEVYLGITDYRFLDDPEVHGIQHIDCYAKLLDEETVLVKQVVPSHPEYECVERLANQIAAQPNCYGRPYEVVRIYCGNYDTNRAAAYTNSLILNQKVLVPLFGISADAGALATYSEAMPGYQVIGIPYGAWYDYDALHCRTMGIFDRHMLRILHRRIDAEVPQQGEYETHAMIDDRSEAGLIADDLRVYWQSEGASEWESIPLTEVGADSFMAAIPWQPAGATVAYYLTAGDATGRFETLPRTAPEGYYRFTVVDNPAHVPDDSNESNESGERGEPGEPGESLQPRLVLQPSVGSGPARLHLDSPVAGPVAVEVFDLLGRRVRTVAREQRPAGSYTWQWDGRDEAGQPCPGGVYLIKASAPQGTATVRFLKLR